MIHIDKNIIISLRNFTLHVKGPNLMCDNSHSEIKSLYFSAQIPTHHDHNPEYFEELEITHKITGEKISFSINTQGICILDGSENLNIHTNQILISDEQFDEIEEKLRNLVVNFEEQTMEKIKILFEEIENNQKNGEKINIGKKKIRKSIKKLLKNHLDTLLDFEDYLSEQFM